MTAATFYGGSETSAPTGNVNLEYGDKRVQIFTPDGADYDITLPDATLLKAGGPHFIIINESDTYSMELRDDGGTLLKTIGPEQCATIGLADNSTADGVWTVSKTLLGGGVPQNGFCCAVRTLGGSWTDDPPTHEVTDHGIWKFDFNTGLTGSRVYDMTADYPLYQPACSILLSNGNIFFGAKHRGVKGTYSNGSYSWSNPWSLASSDYQMLEFAQVKDGRILVAIMYDTGTNELRVATSDDNLETDPGEGSFVVASGVVGRKRIFFAWDGATEDVVLCHRNLNKIFYSDDNGDTWSETAQFIATGWIGIAVYYVYYDVAQEAFFAVAQGTYSGTDRVTIWKSTDGGANWVLESYLDAFAVSSALIPSVWTGSELYLAPHDTVPDPDAVRMYKYTTAGGWVAGTVLSRRDVFGADRRPYLEYISNQLWHKCYDGTGDRLYRSYAFDGTFSNPESLWTIDALVLGFQ